MHQPPTPLEITVAKLQSDVEHIQSDVTDLKADVKGLDAKIDRLAEKVDQKFEKVFAQIASAKTWALLLYIAMGATLLGVMAKGFKWF